MTITIVTIGTIGSSLQFFSEIVRCSPADSRLADDSQLPDLPIRSSEYGYPPQVIPGCLVSEQSRRTVGRTEPPEENFGDVRRGTSDCSSRLRAQGGIPMGRRRTLAIDSLERRDLLSITPLINSPGWVQATAAGTGGSVRPGQHRRLEFDRGQPARPDHRGQQPRRERDHDRHHPPVPNEVARRAFTAKFTGKVLELPPRLHDQAHQFYFLGNGTSSAFLHGTAQVRYYTPNPNPVIIPDPSTPTATSVEQATATTGTHLDVRPEHPERHGDPRQPDRQPDRRGQARAGRPTSTSPSTAAAARAGSTPARPGRGRVDIAYHGNKATVTVHASIFIQRDRQPVRHLPGDHPVNCPSLKAPRRSCRATRILPAASSPRAASRSRSRKARMPASGRFSVSSPSAPRSSPHSVR